jgi:acyl-CoA reductase-like NAD-dependent aldehyde dehydrogenase
VRSRLTDAAVLALAPSFADAGLPPGVVNIVTGEATPAPTSSSTPLMGSPTGEAPGRQGDHAIGR